MRRSILAVDRQQGRTKGGRGITRLAVVMTACLTLLSSEALFAVQTGSDFSLASNGDPRNYDERLNYDPIQRAPTSASFADQSAALNAMGDKVLVSFDERSGVTRSIFNPVGFLTQAQRAEPHAIADSWVNANLAALGLKAADISDYEVTDSVFSDLSGTTHLYMRQRYQGIPVYNAQLHLNINRDGRLISVNNAFVRDLAVYAQNTARPISAAQAVQSAQQHLGKAASELPRVLKVSEGPTQKSDIDQRGISQEPITASLMWLPVKADEVRLVWNFQIWTLDSQHLFDFNVDASDGSVWTRFDLTSDATFRAYERPVESPIHTTPLPPSDARNLIVNPEDSLASPSGWFDSGVTIMDGNNVQACIDADANNVCDSGQPSCTGLVCDFAVNFNNAPSTYRPAAVTNLFYWNNTIHDVQYQYGFNEAAGNFQESNFGRGGAGSDSVNAEGQDGSGTCNANFSTPTDGGNPRMQMYTCNMTNPSRDGDFDSGVIIHEYGHGISTRQVGGPSNSSCLGNRQQAGEGWSDAFALMYTAEAGDVGTDQRGVGAYLFGLPSTGTIRPQPYSTSPSINTYTYASINGLAVPHGVGSVWAQAVWEVYWALVDAHGFEADLPNFDINDPNEAGNKRALYYVNEGLKNTACSPTFVDNRNGIIQAATNSFGGEDVCLIWQAFANFGLGTNAVSGGSTSTTPTNGFNVPTECSGPPPPPPPPPGNCPAGSFDFNAFAIESYADQDLGGTTSVADAGQTLVMSGNTWKRSLQSFTVTPNTVVAFDFASSAQGEIHSIGFDEDQNLNNAARHFQFWGTQNWTGAGRVNITPPAYTGNGAFQAYEIAVGQSYTGTMRLVFGNDNDAGSGNQGRYRCVRVFEAGGPPPGSCTVNQNFESGSAGWTTGGNCATGTFVLGTPTLVTNGGVTTQVAGDNTTGTGNALFTAVNSSAGVDDVDGGTCTLLSPVFNVAAASNLDLAYFHGQRDAGGDAADGMRIEYSVNGGSTFNTLVSIGDVTRNAAWTNAGTTIPAGSNVQIRVQVTDGTASGDLIEGGIDDVSICDQ